ncbi:MAG: V-type ATPase subunit [Clostridiales bacterium]|nr:V-type ATPase subunit [Clostridiales bacterium]
MPQISQPYAIGRVRALSRSLFTRQTVERLLSAGSVQELARVLAELGWGEAEDKAGVERLADKQVQEACRLIREITPEPNVTDCFFARYDILNLKILLKARMLGASDVPLSANGLIDREILRHAVQEADYSALPEEYRGALSEIEARVAAGPDPLFVDARLDRLLFSTSAERLKKVKNLDPAIEKYFQSRADAANILSALRIQKMGWGAPLLDEVLVPGGNVPGELLSELAGDAHAVSGLEKHVGAAFFRALSMGMADVERGQGLAAVEKRLDDHVLSLIRPGRYDILGMLPIVGYLLAREREAAAVRLIAAAKAVGAAEEQLASRLRETYA